MKEPTYRDAFSHGWHLLKEHKIMWIFGLFAALLGQMGVVDIFSKIIVTAKFYTYYPVIAYFPEFLNYFKNQMQAWNLPFDQAVWLFWLLFVLLGFFCIFLFISVVSHGAIIHSVSQYVKGKSTLAHHEAWHAGVRHFWKLLSLQIIKKIGIALLVLLSGAATYTFIISPSSLSTVAFFASILGSLFLGSVLCLLISYASGYVVVEEKKVGESLALSIKMLNSHGLVSFEVASLLLVFNVFVALLAIVFVFLYQIQIAFVAISSLALDSVAFWSVASTFSSFLLTAMIIVIASLSTVFSTSVYTYLFMKMHRVGIVSRIKLLFSRSRA